MQFLANLFSDTCAGRIANSFVGGSGVDFCSEEVVNVCGSSFVSRALDAQLGPTVERTVPEHQCFECLSCLGWLSVG